MDSNIIEAQRALKLPQTGILDELTQAGIRNLQLNNNIIAHGELDQPTLRLLNLSDDTITTDLMENVKFQNDLPLFNNYFLPKLEFVDVETPKKYIFLHHTAGWDNPYEVVDSWAKDARGKIGTEFVIGGQNVKSGNGKYDGVALKTFPKNNYAYHLGGAPISGVMHKSSVGIEICNFGWLTQKNGKYYTYTNAEVPEKCVEKLKKPFRGYQFYHKYTDLQINKVHELLKYLSSLHGIDLKIGLPTMIGKFGVDAFNKYDDIVAGKVHGVLSHTNVRSDKFDISPQKNMMDMLISFNK